MRVRKVLVGWCVAAAMGVAAVGQSAPTTTQWWVSQPGTARWAVKEYRVESRIYGHPRKVTVYSPPGLSAIEAPYDVAYFFDGDDYLADIALPTVMENLVAAKKLNRSLPAAGTPAGPW